ncbi:MAG: hypothetical protein KA155_08610 [Alphaproteobacteria bacterium]|jgi:hypothetical protein|nr:hypothetical protein [Alphaproteobacteria bacterium]
MKRYKIPLIGSLILGCIAAFYGTALAHGMSNVAMGTIEIVCSFIMMLALATLIILPFAILAQGVVEIIGRIIDW